MTDEPLHIRVFETRDTGCVLELWAECSLMREGLDTSAEIERKTAFQPELFFVGEVDGKIVGSVMAGYEGRRGWINYLAVAGALQGRGVGTEMLKHAERMLAQLGCVKVNLQVLNANASVVAFYEKHGYHIDPVISMGKRLDQPVSIVANPKVRR